MSPPASPRSRSVAWLPGCFSPAMVHSLVCSLPQPRPYVPVDGRRQIREALNLVDAYAPRDALEAMLVLNTVTIRCHVRHLVDHPLLVADAALQRRAAAQVRDLERAAVAGGRRLWQHRRERAAEGRARPDPRPPWCCDLDRLEARWRAARRVGKEQAA